MRHVVLTPDALRQFRGMKSHARASIRKAMTERLAGEDPARQDRNRFRLRRPSPHADYELRVAEWRVFYRIEGSAVIVALIGEKRGNRLLIGGEEFVL